MSNVVSFKPSSDTAGMVSGLLLPLENLELLLPNVSIAEVVDYREPTPDSSRPDWFLGKIQWRGQSLPVISFECLNGSDISAIGDNPRIVVINAIGPHNLELPFFSLITRTIPRLVKVDEDGIEEESDESLGSAELMKVSVRGDLATIPNIEYIEKMIYDHW